MPVAEQTTQLFSALHLRWPFSEMLRSNRETVFVQTYSPSAHCTAIRAIIISDLMGSALVNVILSLKSLRYRLLVVPHIVIECV